jgi:hypothetical protein
MSTSKFWVTMTDKFMSGWGKAANKTNKLVIECDTYQQAEIIERNARKRSEMKFVNICSNKPRYGSNVLVSPKHYNDMGEIWKR